MSLAPRFIPPAGTVLRWDEVLGWLGDAVGGRGEGERLREAIQARYGVRHLFLVASARAGMSILLEALRDAGGEKAEVAMPGYTCYSVAASAVRAGLKVRPLDVDPQTLDISRAALAAADLSGAVALIATSLYGIPADLPYLETTARAKGTQLVDDAAQCLHGSVAGRWVGTFGDAGLFSFDKGKCVTSIQGGVIVCHDDALAARLERACTALPPAGISVTATLAAKTIAYAVLLRPWLYWIANAALRLGETPFELDAPMTRYPSALAPLVRRQLARIEEITARRQERAEWLRDALGACEGIRFPSHPAADAVHPRLAVLFNDSARRDRVRSALVAAGIGATASYPRALRDVPEIAPHLAPNTQDTPGARRVAACILTLPTHEYVTARDVRRIAEVVEQA